jgi:hypothetical protein
MKHIKPFENWLNEAKKNTHSYGCAMLYFSLPEMESIHLKISSEDLYTETGNDSYGLETEPHVTLLYGIHSDDVDDVDLFNVCEQHNYSGITVHTVSAFKNEKFEVLKFEVQGNGLRECNRELMKTFPYTSDYPDYHPHCTIAYLKPGTSDKYVEAMKGISYVVAPSRLVYSKPNGDKLAVEL